jgi:hypothetical protein
MSTFRRVPYGSEPAALAYHAATNYALKKTGSEDAAVKFAWWYVDSCARRMTDAEALESAPEWMKKST